MCGFLSLSQPDAILYISYITPMRWGAYILANTALAGKEYSCEGALVTANGKCALSTGEDVLLLYHMEASDRNSGSTIGFYYGMLFMVMGLYALFAVAAVRLRALKISH